MNLKQYTVLCIVAVITVLYFFVDSSPIPVAVGALPAPANRSPSVHREQAVDERIRRHNDMIARLSSGTATSLEWENYWCLLAGEDWKSAIELLGKYDGLPDASQFSGFAAGLNPDDLEHVLQYSATKLPAIAFTRLSMECLHRAASKSGPEFLKLLRSVPDAARPNSIGILATDYLEQDGGSGIRIKDLLMMEPTPDRIVWIEEMLSAAFANHITANRDQIQPIFEEIGASSFERKRALLAQVAALTAVTHPQATCEALVVLPLGVGDLGAATSMASWAARDPEQSGNWLNGIEEKLPGYQWVIAGYVSAAKSLDKQASEKWVKLLSDLDAIEFAKLQSAVAVD